MNILSGKRGEDFVRWLHQVKGFLPPKMSLIEAKEIFLRRTREEERVKNEAQKAVN